MQNDGSTSPLRQFFGQKWVKAILAFDALAIVAILGVVIWNATKTAIIVLDVAPIDASIQIGHGGYTNGQYRLHPGSYDIVISRDGLESKTLSVELKSGFITTVSAFLSGAASEDSDASSPDGSESAPDFSFYEQKNNYASFQKLAEIASKGNNKTIDQDPSAESFIIEYPAKIKKMQAVLPITYTEYGLDPESQSGESLKLDITIRDGRDSDQCETSACIEVLMVAPSDSKTIVEELLARKGIRADDYEIVYKIY